MTQLKLNIDPPKRRTIAKKSNQHFSLGLDQLTHLTLVELQKALTGPKRQPSRTLVTRLALRRYSQEVKTRLEGGDHAWIEAETMTLNTLAQRGPK